MTDDPARRPGRAARPRAVRCAAARLRAGGATRAEVEIARGLDWVLESAEQRGDDVALVLRVMTKWRRMVGRGRQ